MNAMDHCADFEVMCKEIRRILKKGGEFYGSFNLEELPSIEEPQRLTEKMICDNLLKYFDIKSYRMRRKGPYYAGRGDDVYRDFFQSTHQITSGIRILWVGAILK